MVRIKVTVSSGVTRGWQTVPGDTIKGDDTRIKKFCMWLNLENLERRTLVKTLEARPDLV